MIHSKEVDMVRMGLRRSSSLCRVHALNAMLALSSALGKESKELIRKTDWQAKHNLIYDHPLLVLMPLSGVLLGPSLDKILVYVPRPVVPAVVGIINFSDLGGYVR